MSNAAATLAPALTPTRTAPSAVGQALAIAWHTLAQRWRGLLAWTLGLVLMGIMQLSVYPSVAESEEGMQSLVDAWPDALKEAFGLADYTTGAGYLNAELFSLLVPLILVGVALAAGAAATAGEEEQGTLELLATLPARRSTVLAGKVIALVAAVGIAAAAAVATIVVGAPVVDLDVASDRVIAATVLCALLALLFGAVGLLLGALTGRRSVALGTGVGLALAAYLLNVLAPLADWLEPWQGSSPFEWAVGDRPLFEGMAWGSAGLLLAVAALLTAAAFTVFARRDISTR